MLLYSEPLLTLRTVADVLNSWAGFGRWASCRWFFVGVHRQRESAIAVYQVNQGAAGVVGGYDVDESGGSDTPLSSMQ